MLYARKNFVIFTENKTASKSFLASMKNLSQNLYGFKPLLAKIEKYIKYI